MIWFHRLAVLLGGKSLARKIFVSLSHAVIHPGGNEWRHALALSLSEKGNTRRRMASVETLLSFNVSHTSKKTEMYKFWSSNGYLRTQIVVPLISGLVWARNCLCLWLAERCPRKCLGLVECPSLVTSYSYHQWRNCLSLQSLLFYPQFIPPKAKSLFDFWIKFKRKGTSLIKQKYAISNKLPTQIKKYKEKESNDKMLCQFIRAKSIFTNFVPNNGL